MQIEQKSIFKFTPQIISDKHIYSKEELDNIFDKEDESNFDF